MSGHKLVTRNSRYFTPLRYPGGKGQIAYFIKQLVTDSDLVGGHYAEPYAGGAAIALELLLEGYVSKIHINDISRPVYAFWHSVLTEADALCELIDTTPVTVETWDAQKTIIREEQSAGLLELGFAFFFLNRTNRSGILNGGIIGGREQNGDWRIDARYYKQTILGRIRKIAEYRNVINLSHENAAGFIRDGSAIWPSNTLIYLDPPYFEKGKHLYYDFYTADDHKEIANLVANVDGQEWIVSYDNVRQIKQHYRTARRITYGLNYSAREYITGSEVMFFSDGLKIPKIAGGAMKNVRRRFKVAA